MSGLLVAGNVRIGRLTDTGAFVGFLDPLNTTKLAITQPDPDKKIRTSRMKDTLGQALDTVFIAKPTEMTIDFDDQPAEILAMAMIGNIAAISQGSGSATDEAVSLIPGRWVDLAHGNIAASGFNVSTAAAPSTPLVLGTDYSVDYDIGLIKALEGGALSITTACLIDYSYAARSGKRVTGATAPTINCRILLDGKNLANGRACKLEIDYAVLAPTGDIDFMNGDFITTSMKGLLKTLPGQTGPYRYTEYDA